MEEEKLYGSTEGLAEKYGLVEVKSLKDWEELRKKDCEILLNMIHPGYTEMNDKKKSRIREDFAHGNIVGASTSIKWIVEQMKKPESPMYYPNTPDKDLVWVASEFYNLCENIKDYTLENTGEERLESLHDGWGGVMIPEYKAVERTKQLTVKEIKKNIQWAVDRHNKPTSLKDRIFNGKKHPISYEAALEITKYIMYTSDLYSNLFDKEHGDLSIKKALENALKSGVSEHDVEKVEHTTPEKEEEKETDL